MSNLLNSAAVGVRSGDDAGQILRAYIATTPQMIFNHTLSTTATQQPKGTGAGDHLVEPR